MLRLRAAIGAGMLAYCGIASAITLEGVAPMQVFQVDGDTATVALAGAAAGSTVEVRIEDARRSNLTSSWEALGAVSGGRYAGEIRLEEGGPYRIGVRALNAGGDVAEQTEVSGVLAGDLWVLAGQSNMQGVGNLDEHVTEPHPQVHLLRMNHEWNLASEPIHILQESPDPVHGTFASEQDRINAVKGAYEGDKGAGLGMAFAHAMVTTTGRPVGLIATAHGGTSMEQWNPNAKDKGSESLYGSMLAQVKAAGGKVRGVLWYQGESDANPNDAKTYGDRFKTLISSMRSDFGGPEMPFYYVQLGRFVNPGVDHVNWNLLRAEQLRVESEIAPGGLVPAIDLELDDLIHIGTPGLNTLGQRLAHRAQRDLFGGRVDMGPRMQGMELFRTRYGAGIRVRFDHVNGALTSAGRLNGFHISEGADGAHSDCIYKQEVDPKDPTTILLWIYVLPENPHLTYGWGCNPYCNLVDQENMALANFGPVPVSEDVVEHFKKK